MFYAGDYMVGELHMAKEVEEIYHHLCQGSSRPQLRVNAQDVLKKDTEH